MRYLVLSFLCLATVIAYIQRSAMNGATSAMERDLRVTSEDLGLIMSGWYLLYSLFQLPAGWLADRLGSKPALALYCAAWSSLTGLAGLAGVSWTVLLLVWSCMGAAQAGMFPCATKAIGATFPKPNQAFASGMLACCMGLGGALAPLLTGRLIETESWQSIFLLYAAPGLAWCVLFWLLVPRPDAPKPPPEEPANDWHALPPPPPIRWTRLLTDPQMLLLCFQQFLRAGAMAFFYTWFARFLEVTKGLSPKEAGTLAFWPPLVGALGGMVGGFTSDWLLRRTGNSRLARQGMTSVALFGCTAFAGIAYFIDDPHIAVVVICGSTFCAMGSGVSAYALAIAYGGKRVATVFSTMNMSGNLGATLFPAVVTALVAASGNWNHALLMFGGMFGLAIVCWLFLNPKGTLFEESSEVPSSKFQVPTR
ncbi:MAG: MFS transporter [Gemmataceae bacterium]